MITIEQLRENGYLYDSLENYPDLINFSDMVDIKTKIDEKNIKRHSKYDYWYKHINLSYMEEIVYDNLFKIEKNLPSADYIYEKSHEYMLKKIEECNFYPTWVFGTSMDDEILTLIHSNIISDFQKKFINKYYSDKKYTKYILNNRLQFYDRGCEIKLHDDGQPENRICVFLYFLNDEWNEENGGYLLLHTKANNIIKIKPTFPNYLVLDSDINLFHELIKVNKNIKYNIVSFYSGEV